MDDEFDWDKEYEWGDLVVDVADVFEFEAKTRDGESVELEFYRPLRIYARSARAMAESARITTVLVARNHGVPVKLVYPKLERVQFVTEDEGLHDVDADHGTEE